MDLKNQTQFQFPSDILSDEHHIKIRSKKAYIATTVGQNCFLGMGGGGLGKLQIKCLGINYIQNIHKHLHTPKHKKLLPNNLQCLTVMVISGYSNFIVFLRPVFCDSRNSRSFWPNIVGIDD